MRAGQREASRRHSRGRSDALLLAVAALILSPPALAGPRTIDDCEAIKDAGAYNLCLASFGPVRGQHGATYPGVASEGDKGRNGANAARKNGGTRHAAASRGYGESVFQRRGGRIRMEFTPGRR